MKVTDTTPRGPRTFSVEMDEEDVKIIATVFGYRSRAEADRDGTSSGREYLIYCAFSSALVKGN